MRCPLRILVAHNVSKQRTGGMSRLMSFIHDEVAAAGHSVDFYCAEDLPESVRGRSARFSFPLSVVRYARIAAQTGQPYDVINIHEPSGAAIAILKKLAGNPRVAVTTYGVEERGWARLLEEADLGREQVRLKSRFLYPATLLWQARLALTQADHVFCSNMEDHEYLTSRFGVSANRITRIHSGAASIYAEESCNRDYSKAERLLFAGTWLRRKGTYDLIPAFSQLAERYPNLKLVVLNGGAQEADIRALFPEQVRCRVICQQSEPEKGIAAAMAAADIYLLPSLFEGTPLTLIEAMFGGMPIVTTATCGMKDVIADGRNGLLIPLRSPDALVASVERLLNDPPLRARLGQTARSEALQLYNWQRVAEPVRRVYEQLCGEDI